MKTGSIIQLLLLMALLCACDVENPIPDPIENPEYANWIIPKNEIIRRGTENDFIPSLDNPEFLPATAAEHLKPEDLILGLNIKGDYRAYPLNILNYHEVVNDEFAAGEKMISYCPLSGSNAVWDRKIQGISTEFGVSKFVYNSNHLLYDRVSKGHWLPLKYICVNGELEEFELDPHQMIETTWDNWLTMFPGSKVMMPPGNSGFNYNIDSYDEYKNNDTLLFSVNPKNPGLQMKEKVHGIIVDKRMKAYSLEIFGDSTRILHDNFQGFSIVVIGNRSKQFIVSFESRIPGGPELDFLPATDPPNILMTDNEGNKYDIFGLVVDGPRKGQALTPTHSISGYWFVLASMYPDPIFF